MTAAPYYGPRNPARISQLDNLIGRGFRNNRHGHCGLITPESLNLTKNIYETRKRLRTVLFSLLFGLQSFLIDFLSSYFPRKQKHLFARECLPLRCRKKVTSCFAYLLFRLNCKHFWYYNSHHLKLSFVTFKICSKLIP